MKVRRGVVASLTLAVALGTSVTAPGVSATPRPATGVAPVSSVGTATDGASPAIAGGWLLIETGAVDTVSWDADRNPSTANPTQTLGSKGCELVTDESLLRIDGFVSGDIQDRASFASDALGVAEKKTGVSCYQVDSGTRERLELTLANARAAASSAFLDMELKQGARVLAVASLRGEPVGWYDLQSGGNVDTPLPATAAPLLGDDPEDVVAFECQANADSGPDAKVGDNCRWPISKPSWMGEDGVFFDSLALHALAGSFSLKGGSDGLVPTAEGVRPPAGFPQRASFFELADGLLDCGQATPALLAINDTPQVRVRRLPLNAVVGGTREDCRPVPYSLRNGSRSARFLKPLTDQPGAQFVLEMVWSVTPTADSTALPGTTIDYESGTTDEFPLTDVPLGWCPDPIRDGWSLNGIANPGAAPDQDELLGPQFACVGVQQSYSVGSGTSQRVKVYEQIYLLGDAFYRK